MIGYVVLILMAVAGVTRYVLSSHGESVQTRREAEARALREREALARRQAKQRTASQRRVRFK